MRPPRYYDQDFMAQRGVRINGVPLYETSAFLLERHLYSSVCTTVGPWYNETLYNEDIGLTSGSLCSSYSAMYARRLRYNTHPSRNTKHIFPCPPSLECLRVSLK